MIRHDCVGKDDLLAIAQKKKKLKFDQMNIWSMHQLESMRDNEKHKIL